VIRRAVAVALVVIGVAVTGAGLYGRFLLSDDEGHHDGRPPTFARSAVDGADVLVVEPTSGGATARVERAGQVLVDYDQVHGGAFHTFAVGSDLDSYVHDVAAQPSPDGTYQVGPLAAGEHRVVVQAAPAGGPDLLELGTDVTIAEGEGSDVSIADGDTWSNGDLTIRRQGFDFVLSEPWTGEERYGGPAFLALFHADDLAFAHAHATMIGDDRFGFALDLPGRGRYLAALELVQDGEPLTALFRFDV